MLLGKGSERLVANSQACQFSKSRYVLQGVWSEMPCIYSIIYYFWFHTFVVVILSWPWIALKVYVGSLWIQQNNSTTESRGKEIAIELSACQKLMLFFGPEQKDLYDYEKFMQVWTFFLSQTYHSDFPDAHLLLIYSIIFKIRREMVHLAIDGICEVF